VPLTPEQLAQTAREIAEEERLSGRQWGATDTSRRLVKVRSIRTLADVQSVFRRWLGDEYDMDALNTTLAAAAVGRLDGDPCWVLIVSGSVNAKTETVQSLSGAGAVVTSTITSDGALLSGSPKRDKQADSTGGLLRILGSTGLLVIKDVTSILSMNRDTRGMVLAALREIHDGRWQRNVGTDGGRTLTWTGRLTVIGAVTTAWDRAHDVIASMGDRFVILRMDSHIGGITAGRRAVANTGDEDTMRAELAAAVGAVLEGIGDKLITVTDVERDRILAAADVVTLARTAVDYDYRGDVIDAHAPEMPTRLGNRWGCARLSFHGGSLLAGFRPGLVTGRIARAVRSRRFQFSTATGTSPSSDATAVLEPPRTSSASSRWSRALSVRFALLTGKLAARLQERLRQRRKQPPA